MSHTELPWHVSAGSSHRIWSDDTAIADCNPEQAGVYREKTKEELEANAEFIVRAVNNHYQLLEALIDLQADIGSGKKFCGHDFTCTCAWDKAVEAIKEAEK